MPGEVHQTLLLWLARRMTTDGFRIAGFDGTAVRGGRFNRMPAPFVLRGRRPDAWGANDDGSLIAFGEAKSAADIVSGRTISQLRVFGSVRMKTGAACPLYIAVSREAAPNLDGALRAAGLAGSRNVVRLHVPEVLLTESGHAA